MGEGRAVVKARAWTTPDALPASEKCVQVMIPDDLDFFSMLKGALLELTDIEMYEQIGALTPEECAAYWEDWYLSLTWDDCP